MNFRDFSLDDAPGGTLFPYAAAVGRGANYRQLVAAGWRFMAQPDWVPSFAPLVALDNGAYRDFLRGRYSDFSAFESALKAQPERFDFAVVPDIVCGGHASLDLSLHWLEKLRGLPTRLLIAVQDGMQVPDVAPFLSSGVGLFVGGSTEWKEKTVFSWSALARSAGSYCHVGRVNSARRIRLCTAAGVNSFDGSGVSRFGSEIRRLDFARRQPDLLSGSYVTPGLCAMGGTT